MSDTKKLYIRSFIGVLLMFGIGRIPPIGALTPTGMNLLGVLIGLIYLWSAVGVFWPSLLGLLALIIYGQTAAALSPLTYGNYIVIMMVFSFAIIFAISETGVFDYLLNWLLNLKITKGHPWVLTWIFLVGLHLIFIIGGGFPFLFVMWEILFKTADIAGIPRKSKYCGAMVVGMMFALVLASYTLPFKSAFLIAFGFLAGMMSIAPMNMATTTIVMFLSGFVAINIYFLLIKFVLRPDLSGLKNADVSKMARELPPMNSRQKVAIAYLILFIVMMLLTGFTQFLGTSALVKAYERIGILGVCWIVAMIMAIIHVDGAPILEVSKVSRMIPWDTVCLVAMVFGLSTAMNQSDTGIGAFFTSLLNPLFAGRGMLFFYIVLFTVILIATNFLNNAVVMLVGFAIITAYSASLPINLSLTVILMCYMANTAFLLPSSSMQASLIYTQVQQVSNKNILISAVLTMVSIFITMLIVIIPVGNFFFG